MTQIVVPFRGESGKQRLDAPDRSGRARAGDARRRPHRVRRDRAHVPRHRRRGGPRAGGGARCRGGRRSGRRQGAAVAAALERVDDGAVIVVNADVPCVVPHDLRTLAGAAELGRGRARGGRGRDDQRARASARVALRAALRRRQRRALPEHFDAQGVIAVAAAIPNLRDDVDTMDDLQRIGLRAGPRTQAAIGRLVAAEGRAPLRRRRRRALRVRPRQRGRSGRRDRDRQRRRRPRRSRSRRLARPRQHPLRARRAARRGARLGPRGRDVGGARHRLGARRRGLVPAR